MAGQNLPLGIHRPGHNLEVGPIPCRYGWMVILAPKTRQPSPPTLMANKSLLATCISRCAEVTGARATRWRRRSSASLGIKDGASQEDKGGRNVTPRWTAFQVRHLREEGNVVMVVTVDGHLFHKPVQYQSQRFWRVVTWFLIWATNLCHVRNHERSSAGYPGATEINPGVSQ